MCRILWTLPAWLLALSAMLFSHSVAAQDRDLTTHLPVTGNTLLLVDATRIYASPLARREHWQADHARGVTAGGMALPPGTERLAAAANLDLEFLEPLWEAGVLRMSAPPPLAQIAVAYHGSVEAIGGHSAAFLPNDACIVEFDSHHVGIMSPAHRQRIGQWLQFDAATSARQLAPYLQRVLADEARHPSALVLAFNLEHAVSAETIKAHVAPWSGERLSDVPSEELVAMLASLTGARVEIHISEAIVGRLRVDFGTNIRRLAPIAKELVLETLAGSGAMVADLNGWQLTMEDQAIVLSGAASARGIERALSIIQLPLEPLEATRRLASTPAAPGAAATPTLAAVRSTASVTPTPASSPPPAPKESLPFQASLDYFRAVRRLLGDLKQDKHDAVSVGQIGLWYDTYARKIDMLPMHNVDPELVAYGEKVATDLRGAADAVKQGGIEAYRREMQITPLNTMTARYSRPNYGYGYGSSRYGYSRYGHSSRYGRYGYPGRYGGVIGTYYFQQRNLSSERRKVRTDERAKAFKSVVTIMGEVDAATAEIRHAMTQKYDHDF